MTFEKKHDELLLVLSVDLFYDESDNNETNLLTNFELLSNIKNIINCKCLTYKNRCTIIEKHRASCKKLTCRKNIK